MPSAAARRALAVSGLIAPLLVAGVPPVDRNSLTLAPSGGATNSSHDAAVVVTGQDVAPQQLFTNGPAATAGCASTVTPVENGFGILGDLTAAVLFVVPLDVMRKVIQRGSIEAFSAVTYLVSALQCGLWTIYALPQVTPCRIPALAINITGCVLEVGYTILFLVYAGARRTPLLMQTIAVAIAFLLLALFGAVVAPHIDFTPFPVKTPPLTRQSSILGLICTALNIAMYAAPLSVMGQVIRTKSVEYMPLSLSVASLVNAAVWLIYGILSGDIYITACNLAGVVLALAQVALYSWYCRFSGSKSKGADQTKGKAMLEPAAEDPQSCSCCAW